MVLVREDRKSREAYTTFDYSDLNAYLLLVIGLVQPNENEPLVTEKLTHVADKTRKGEKVTLREIQNIGPKEALITLPESASLAQAVETFGSGVHRIIITRDGSTDTVGVLTQLRLVSFFRENGVDFPSVEELLPVPLKDLGIGARPVVSIKYTSASPCRLLED